ncbi:MAG TPA: hypothetical protein VH592_25990 [Gemmataceae bacterium]|jgi:hypothetical protein
MWTTVALLSALSYAPGQAEQLELKNPHFTYGILGQERKDDTFLPGDMVVLSFNIEGLKIKPDGTAQYSMGMKLFNHKKNKYVFEKDPQENMVVNSLGGSHQPGYALTNLFPDTEPGEYTIRVDVKDVQGNTSAKPLERKFTVKKLEFGIVRPGFVYLELNENQAGAMPSLAPPLAVPGQNLMLHFTTVGFTEAGEKNEPKVSVEVVVQDESGKPVLAKAIGGKATSYPDEEARKLKILPFRVPVQVNRTGKFKIVITAKDENAGKTATFPPLDLTTVEVK